MSRERSGLAETQVVLPPLQQELSDGASRSRRLEAGEVVLANQQRMIHPRWIIEALRGLKKWLETKHLKLWANT